MARWYIIHAYSGFENKVRDSIISEAERLGLSEVVEEVEVPTETVTDAGSTWEGRACPASRPLTHPRRRRIPAFPRRPPLQGNVLGSSAPLGGGQTLGGGQRLPAMSAPKAFQGSAVTSGQTLGGGDSKPGDYWAKFEGGNKLR